MERLSMGGNSYTYKRQQLSTLSESCKYIPILIGQRSENSVMDSILNFFSKLLI